MGHARKGRATGKEEPPPPQPGGAPGSSLPERFLGLLLSGPHHGSAPGATSLAAGSAARAASEDEKNRRTVLSRAGPATAVHSAWGGTGAFRGHVLARGDPSSLPGLLQGSQSRARPPKICLARGGEHREPGRRCCHLRPGALGWLPAPRGVPYLEHLLLGGVVGVGQAVPSLSVLAGDEVPSLLGAAVRGDGLGGGEPSGPEPVGSVISQHDEELWESPMVMASPRASGRSRIPSAPASRGRLWGCCPDRGAAWPLSTPRPALSASPAQFHCTPECLTCTISLDQTLVSSFRLCTLEMLEPRLRCCPAGSRRVSTPRSCWGTGTPGVPTPQPAPHLPSPHPPGCPCARRELSHLHTACR